jgi:hypothetical protein
MTALYCQDLGRWRMTLNAGHRLLMPGKVRVCKVKGEVGNSTGMISRGGARVELARALATDSGTCRAASTLEQPCL